MYVLLEIIRTNGPQSPLLLLQLNLSINGFEANECVEVWRETRLEVCDRIQFFL